ncbi:restriction endonuclease [Fictibacillus phosphorivorans]|uniref:restriction endonuclease n=1 Tax=Fictibacillus phosphorivorans TaxID=1221500 RepID=UPI0012E7A563|nr:restriction endonuclease [Fictibacillus phosphorivorans]
MEYIQRISSGSIYWRTTNAMVITNRYFTPNAKKLAKSGMVELIDLTGMNQCEDVIII